MTKKYVFAFASFLLLFSCSKSSSNGPSTTASVMFVNGCIPSTPLAFNIAGSVNNVAANNAGNIALLQNSGYQSVTAGTDSISISTSGSVILGGTSHLLVDSSYSVFLGGSGHTPSYLLITDDLSAPATGNCKIRFVNLSSDMPTENCYVGISKVDSNLGYNTASAFLQIPASSSTSITLQNQSNTAIQALLSGQSLVAGKIYTVMLTGTSTGSGASALTLTLITNK